MKIENDKKSLLLDNLINAGQVKRQKDTGIAKKGNEESPDRVELSTRNQEVEKLKERVKAAPAINQEKINAIKDAIKNETYNIRGELVARDIVKSNILDEIL
ncbi:MAG TPA: flagellar biosynthesis anti-sigma factor FlgM [Syntrophorhabdaceae bacterium]|nr:flagellar biosynthesis anti-sigma factor FlgM [Syntrophorhabdaceae bacterium]HNT68453.1 flagellar biosynthesis anti-sigma factor FlgM [Syntrophorhabdaceae bacterium]